LERPETVMANTGRNATWSIVQLVLTSGTVLAAPNLEEGSDYLDRQVGSGT
jgi:hypothetical protein